MTAGQSLMAATAISLQPGFHHFHYVEYNTLGRELDRETGWMPGMLVEARTRLMPQMDFSLQAALYRAELDYIGQTQSGRPVSTNTAEDIRYFGGRLSYALNPQLQLFASGRYSEWERDIRNIGNVSGLYEVYKWWEVSAGFRIPIGQVEQHSWYFEASVLRTRQPEIFVDLSRVNGGSTTLEMGEETGGRLQLESTQNSAGSWSFGILTYVEFWDFGRSNTLVTTGGVSRFIVTEPRSETRNVGFRVKFDYRF